MKIDEIVKFLSENKEMITTVIVLITTILRTTKWGLANKEALDMVVQTIEHTGSNEVKCKMKESHENLSSSAQEAVCLAVRKADPNKKTPKRSELITREALKTFGVKMRNR